MQRRTDRERGNLDVRDCNELCHHVICALGFPYQCVRATATPASVLVCVPAVSLCRGDAARQTPGCLAFLL